MVLIILLTEMLIPPEDNETLDSSIEIAENIVVDRAKKGLIRSNYSLTTNSAPNE